MTKIDAIGRKDQDFMLIIKQYDEAKAYPKADLINIKKQSKEILKMVSSFHQMSVTQTPYGL